jgi:hypothetical protein
MFCGFSQEPLGFGVCGFLGFPFAFVCFGPELGSRTHGRCFPKGS